MKVPNSPAAVSSMLGVSYLCHCSSERTGRRCTGNESEDLQNKVEKLSIRGKWAVRKWFKIIIIYLCQEGLRYYWSVLFHWVQVYSGSLPRRWGEDTITGKVHQIEKVTVTARRSPNKVTSAVPIQTISRQDISQLGIQNMADAVRRFAGANVKDYGGIGGLKTVSIRNMGAAHTAVSYDGVAVSNCQAGR